MKEIVFSDSSYSVLYKYGLKNIYIFDKDFSIGDISNINYDININEDVRIWTSYLSVRDYLGFLYLCSKINNISVIFTDNYDENAYSLSCIDSNEVYKLLKYEKNLSKKEIDKYSNEWKRLVKENSNLRVFKNKKIISVNYDYLKDYVFNYYRNDKSLMQNIGILMSYDDENNFSDTVYKVIIDKLIGGKNE